MPSAPEFPNLVNGTWALATRRAPWCFVLPNSASELSRTVTALRDVGDGAGDWHIAVRSGGHGSGESNNIAQGVTIDLSYLNRTTYDATTKLASVGTGSRWLDVYIELHKHGVNVAGGREGIVGVGGFVLGGGNTFFTGRYGFSCDTVVNYEVVLANGEIINANASANSDLWRALKGGSSNFGIVTKFDMVTIPATNLTMQTRYIAVNHSDEVADAVAAFSDLDESYSANAMLTAVSYSPLSGQIVNSVLEVNTLNDLNTTAYDQFNRIPTLEPSRAQSMTLLDVSNRSVVQEGTL
jgi:FAD/FMN-containing dehydrogenase